MADVTVNISGNADGLKREIEDVGRRAREVENGVNDVYGKTAPPSGVFPSTGGGTREVVPTTPSGTTVTPTRQPDIIPDRVVEELRREAENRQLKPGSQEFNNAVEELQKTSQSRLDQDITADYSQKRSNLREEMENAYRKIDDDVERQKNERIQMMGQQAYNDPLRKPQVDQEFEDLRNLRYRDVGREYDEKFDKLDEDEKTERTQSEAQLTEAIRQLTEELNRIAGTQTSDPNSFINRLREERRQAVQERDNAPTEEEAQQAQQRVSEIDGRLRRIQGGEEPEPGVDRFGGANVASGINAANSVAGGDLAGTVTSAAMMFGAKAFIPAAIIAGLIKSMQIGSETMDQAGDLARLRGTTGTSGAEALRQINPQFANPISGGKKIGDLGLEDEEFRRRAFQTIRASGSSQDWARNTFESAAVEKNLGLNEGALVQGSQYDRYGKNVIDAILDLTNTLSEIRTSGVTGSDFTRVQERFDIQQGIMAGYMNRTDKPDYDVANRLLAGFSAVPVTQDQRTGTDIQDFQQAIQNPMNDRMRALLYGVIGDLAPETQGRVDLAERYRLDPENEGRLIQATVQRVTQMYGGTQTTQGFMAFRSLFPNIAPERLDQYINAFQNPDSEASKRLIEELKTGNRVVSREESVQAAAGYSSDLSKLTMNLSQDTKNFFTQKINEVTDAIKDPSTIMPSIVTSLMPSILPLVMTKPLNQ